MMQNLWGPESKSDMQIVQLNLSTTVTLGTEESGRYTRCEEVTKLI